MTIPTFPTLPGLTFPVKKTPTFQSVLHKSVAGVATVQAMQPYAIYAYELPFEFLRSDSVNLELQTLLGFYQAQRGMALPFHFLDPDDSTVTLQSLGVGDGVTTQFALIRTLVSAVDPILDVDVGSITVYVNGVSAPFTVLTTSQYGTIYGVNITTPPGGGLAITATFTYKFLCRFSEDSIDLSKLFYLSGSGLWSSTVKFASVLQ
jgi:uncharacterized protein (TIGR02217 family)